MKLVPRWQQIFSPLEIYNRANELLDMVGLKEVKNNLATNMSGGQQQRRIE